VAFTYLTVKSAKCLCLLPVVLVLRIRFCLYLWGQGPPMITTMLQGFLNIRLYHSTCLAWLWLIPDQTIFPAAIQQQRTSASLFQRFLYCRVCFSLGLGLSYGLRASSSKIASERSILTTSRPVKAATCPGGRDRPCPSRS